MSKKVPGANVLVRYDERVGKNMPAEIYVTVDLDGETDAYRNTYETKEDAVDRGEHTEDVVATYKLVKIEELKLVRTTTVVAVKE